MDFDSFDSNVYICFGVIIGFILYGVLDFVDQIRTFFYKKNKKRDDNSL